MLFPNINLCKCQVKSSSEPPHNWKRDYLEHLIYLPAYNLFITQLQLEVQWLSPLISDVSELLIFWVTQKNTSFLVNLLCDPLAFAISVIPEPCNWFCSLLGILVDISVLKSHPPCQAYMPSSTVTFIFLTWWIAVLFGYQYRSHWNSFCLSQFYTTITHLDLFGEFLAGLLYHQTNSLHICFTLLLSTVTYWFQPHSPGFICWVAGYFLS